jgi:selenide,water dikinase
LIVGGGVGSIEIAMCLRSAFLGRNIESNSPLSDILKIIECLDVVLCTGADNIGRGLNDSCINKVREQFTSLGIEIQTSARINQIAHSHCETTDKRKIPTDLMIWATDAQAIPILSELDLPVDSKGFLLTRPTLQSTGDDHIFVVGDAGTLNETPTAKAGVFAVRQGPILFQNIVRSIAGQRLVRYVPQRKFLKLLNIGNGLSIAEYGSQSKTGRFWWWLKNRIDTRFVEMYQDYSPAPMMEQANGNDSDETAMRCLGCGGKIGGEILSQALASLDQHQHPDVVLGLNGSDDAAIIRTYDDRVTASTDFFAAPLSDPYLVGRISAINSLSDLFVMGAQPTAGLATIQIPEGHPKAQSRVLHQVMNGANREFSLASAAIVGGHTIAGPQLLVGFTVLGRQIMEPKAKGGLRAGDSLILSKPLGSGVLLAALMQSKLPGMDFVSLIDNLLIGNSIALDVARQFHISAMTDVTGFGFAGHLSEMLLASNKSARLELRNIPLLPGVTSLIEKGINSTLADENMAYAQRINNHNLPTSGAVRTAVFDPQTCGGILFGIASEHANALLRFLGENGFANAAVVGTISEPDQAGPAVFYK